jgi:predicted TIM-barrel fold metal-dependent hydrolase
MRIDVAAFLGDYPYRFVEPATPEWLLVQLDRLGLDRAWVAHLPSFLYKDPRPGNVALERLTQSHRDRLRPVPTIHPGLPGWIDDLNLAAGMGAPAVRMYPPAAGLDPAGGEMRVAAATAAAAQLPIVLTVKLEDVRQRHPLDVAPDLPPSAVRTLVRSDPDVRILVTHAERAFVEEVHFGLTPDEASRVLWDISWIWGAPEDHLALLLETIGTDRFTLGTGMPLRIPDAAMAKLDLLGAPDDVRTAILGDNLDRWMLP